MSSVEYGVFPSLWKVPSPSGQPLPTSEFPKSPGVNTCRARQQAGLGAGLVVARQQPVPPAHEGLRHALPRVHEEGRAVAGRDAAGRALHAAAERVGG